LLVMEEGAEGIGRYARGVHLSGKALAEQMGRQATILKPSSPEFPFDYQPRPVIAEGLAVLVAGILKSQSSSCSSLPVSSSRMAFSSLP